MLLIVSACALANAEVPTAGTDQTHADLRTALPVTAEELMPLETRRGVYLVTEGAEQGLQVPFTLEQHGDQWILIQQRLARHELHRDHQGNWLIDRETDLRQDRQIEYVSPVILVPATVDWGTSLTGRTRVIVSNTRTKSVKYRGSCTWQLDFIGMGSFETPSGTVPVYRLRAKREIRLPLAQISMTIDFEYVRGTGMVATGVDQVTRSLGLFTERDLWRLEQLPQHGSSSFSLPQHCTTAAMSWTASRPRLATTTTRHTRCWSKFGTLSNPIQESRCALAGLLELV